MSSTVIPVTARHKSCLICLWEGHVRDKCSICTSFPTITKKLKDFHLKVLLMEETMHPSFELDSNNERTDSVSTRSVSPTAPASKHKSGGNTVLHPPQQPPQSAHPTLTGNGNPDLCLDEKASRKSSRAESRSSPRHRCSSVSLAATIPSLETGD